MTRFELQRQYEIAARWRGMRSGERRFTFTAIKERFLPAARDLEGGEDLAEAFGILLKQIGEQTGQQ